VGAGRGSVMEPEALGEPDEVADLASLLRAAQGEDVYESLAPDERRRLAEALLDVFLQQRDPESVDHTAFLERLSEIVLQAQEEARPVRFERDLHRAIVRRLTRERTARLTAEGEPQRE